MSADGRGCGSLYALYRAARDRNPAAVEAAWQAFESRSEGLESAQIEDLGTAVAADEFDRVAALSAELLYSGEETARLDGWPARALGATLYVFGYLASFVLFFRARSLAAVARRLRWAYSTVGVDIRDTEAVDGAERTVFRCPYRTVGARRWGQRYACHDVLDRVDDGYVTFLARHRDIEYQRPRACAGSECCYSEVAER
jgi:hypothetical protein